VFDPDVAITRQLFWTLSDNYDVVTANDLRRALHRAAAYEPMVVVLDLSDSDFSRRASSGLRIFDYVKSHFPKCRVLGMTSEEMTGTKQKYFKLGVDALLEKPFDTEQLLTVLRRLASINSLDSTESGAFQLCY
jgi:CheY-like chemotaxis protein